MQYGYPQMHQGYPYFRGASEPRECYYPPTNYYYPHIHGYPLPNYPSGSSNYYYNSFPGQPFNAGGNHHDGHGIQRNGNVKLGNGSDAKLGNGVVKRKNRKATNIGGCHGNQGGYQVSGDVIFGDLY